MGNRRIQKYVRLLLMVTPFLVPWLMILVEEICGKGMGWNYVLIAIFLTSLTALYIWGCVSAVLCKNRTDVAYELFMFHFVKLPLFVVAWGVYMIVFMIICFSINGFDNIQ